MNICSGKGFSSSKSTSKTLESLPVGVAASANLAQMPNPCRPNGHLKKICRPNVCRPNVLSPKRPYTPLIRLEYRSISLYTVICTSCAIVYVSLLLRGPVSTQRKYQTPLHGHRLRTCLQHHQRTRYNNSATCCTTNSPQTDKNLPHPNIWTCRDVGLWHCDVANLLYNKLYNCCELVRWWCCTTCP